MWWIDAGWYPCYNKDHERRWWITGTWKPDPERFPRGLKPVSDHAARNGADLLVWFEPERVQPGTELDVEHPDWLLRAKDSDNGLLNLGNPECRQWLTDHVCRLIQDNGIRIYRQDHNFPPLEHWRENEAEDRQGMNENLHVQGYLQFWDDLLARNPGLWIDSCASGGRRNDLETMRRSVPLHYTDYGYGDHPVKLAFHHTLYQWIPYFKECTLSWDLAGIDRFDNERGQLLVPLRHGGHAVRHPGHPPRRLRLRRWPGKMIAIWRKASGMILHGDYYPHTPFHKSAEKWVAWQFDRPEAGDGFVQAIRLPAAPEETITIRLKGMSPDAAYAFTNAETGERREMSGRSVEPRGIHGGAAAAQRGHLVLPQRQAGMTVRLVSSIEAPDFGAETVRVGDLNGDGSPDLLFVQSDYGSREIRCLTATTIHGERLWQAGEPSAANGRIYSDLPVQVYDWDDDGVNEVLYVRQATYAEPTNTGSATSSSASAPAGTRGTRPWWCWTAPQAARSTPSPSRRRRTTPSCSRTSPAGGGARTSWSRTATGRCGASRGRARRCGDGKARRGIIRPSRTSTATAATRCSSAMR